MLSALEALMVVFSLVLLITKSKLFACKREFVHKRYEAAKVNNQKPSWIHKFWHAWWTCSMCSGFQFAIPIAFVTWSGFFIIPGALILGGGNWILHCLENCLFGLGKIFEKIFDEQEDVV